MAFVRILPLVFSFLLCLCLIEMGFFLRGNDGARVSPCSGGRFP
jgi:hypothetical protein